MAPHDTNTGKEAKRHAAPLIGMAVIVAFVAAGFIWWVIQATDGADAVDEVTEEVETSPQQ
jgi:hypothetical protein